MKWPILFLLITLFSCRSSRSQDAQMENQLSAIRDYLTEKEARDSLHGVIFIAKGNEIILEEAYGYVDSTHTQEHTTASKIGIASMGKMFTALSIMQLESEGNLELTDKIGDHLPGHANHRVKDSVTIEHLLTHTSGLGDYSSQLNYDREYYGLKGIYELVQDDSPSGPIGIKFNYSNSGYIILGKIIEAVSGMKYQDYVELKIFRPTGMSQADFNSTLFKGGGISDAGGRTPAGDIWEFSQALRKGLLVDKATLQRMTEDHSGTGYGYGFTIKYMNEQKIYGHTGGLFLQGTDRGIASALDIIPEQDITVIILTNRNPSMGGGDARNYMLETLTSGKR